MPWLHRLAVLRQVHPRDLRDQALVGQVDVVDPHLRSLEVQQSWRSSVGEVLELLVGIHEARLDVGLRVPVVDRELGDRDGALVERAFGVDDLVDVDLRRATEPLAGHAHAVRQVEAERGGWADMRLAQAAEQDPQHRVRVGGGADGRARVRAHPLLVHDDRRAQVAQGINVRPAEARHEGLDEGRVGLVDEPLRLGRDRAEHERRLARSRHAGEDRQATLRDVERDVLARLFSRAPRTSMTSWLSAGARSAVVMERSG